MPYIPLEKLVKGEDASLYKLVLTAAMRANELTKGATPFVKSESKKVAVISLQEIAADKIWYEAPKQKGKKSES